MTLFLREQYDRIKGDRFLLAWNISILVVILLPLLIFGVARLGVENHHYGNYYNSNNNNNNNSQLNWNQLNQWRYDQNGNFMGQKHWWQFWKRNNHYDRNGNEYYGQQHQQQNQNGAPWWCKCNQRKDTFVVVVVISDVFLRRAD